MLRRARPCRSRSWSRRPRWLAVPGRAGAPRAAIGEALPLDELSRPRGPGPLVRARLVRGRRDPRAGRALGRRRPPDAASCSALGVGLFAYLESGVSIAVVRQISMRAALDAADRLKPVYLAALMTALARGDRRPRARARRAPLDRRDCGRGRRRARAPARDASRRDRGLLRPLTPMRPARSRGRAARSRGRRAPLASRGLARRRRRPGRSRRRASRALDAVTCSTASTTARSCPRCSSSCCSRAGRFRRAQRQRPRHEIIIRLRHRRVGARRYGLGGALDQPDRGRPAVHAGLRRTGDRRAARARLARLAPPGRPSASGSRCRCSCWFAAGVGPRRLARAVGHRVAQASGSATGTIARARVGTRHAGPFVLRADKSYFFSADGRAFLAYKVVACVAVISGDPGDPDGSRACRPLFSSSRTNETGVSPSSERVSVAPSTGGTGSGRSTTATRDRRHRIVLARGPPVRKVRQSVHRLERAGYRDLCLCRRSGQAARRELEVAPDSGADAAAARLHHGVRLAFRGRGRGRAVRGRDGPGRRSRRLLPPCPLAGRRGALALVDAAPETTPNGFNEWLVAETVGWARQHSFERVSLNFSPFAAVLAPSACPLCRRSTPALHELKGTPVRQPARFQPQVLSPVEQRFVVFERRGDLPRVGIAALAAEAYCLSGGGGVSLAAGLVLRSRSAAALNSAFFAQHGAAANSRRSAAAPSARCARSSRAAVARSVPRRDRWLGALRRRACARAALARPAVSARGFCAAPALARRRCEPVSRGSWLRSVSAPGLALLGLSLAPARRRAPDARRRDRLGWPFRRLRGAVAARARAPAARGSASGTHALRDRRRSVEGHTLGGASSSPRCGARRTRRRVHRCSSSGCSVAAPCTVGSVAAAHERAADRGRGGAFRERLPAGLGGPAARRSHSSSPRRPSSPAPKTPDDGSQAAAA